MKVIVGIVLHFEFGFNCYTNRYIMHMPLVVHVKYQKTKQHKQLFLTFCFLKINEQLCFHRCPSAQPNSHSSHEFEPHLLFSLLTKPAL